MMNASNTIQISRDELNGQSFVQHYRSLRGQGLTALEQCIMSDVLSRMLNGQALTTSKQTLADDYAAGLSTVKAAIKRLRLSGHIVVNTYLVEGKQRTSEITLGPAGIELLTGKAKKAPETHDVSTAPPTPRPVQEIAPKPKEEAPAAPKENPVPVVIAPAPVPSFSAPRRIVNEYTESNTSNADITEVRYEFDDFIAPEDLKRLTYWPAKGRGLSRADVITVMGWSGVLGETYADNYIQFGGMPGDPKLQLEHCLKHGRDVRYKLDKIHARTRYGYDHSYD